MTKRKTSNANEIAWTHDDVTLGSLEPWEHNPRHSTKAQAKRMLGSLDDLGQFQTIAIGPETNGKSPVYDGHQRLSALLAANGASFVVHVLRSSRPLTVEERRRLILAAHAGATGSWNWDALAGWDGSELIAGGLDADYLAMLNADAAALATMLEADAPAPVDDVEPQIDRAEELRVKWGVEPGQLWQLGAHRLICGDCTDRAVVERVMDGELARLVVTDPPYGVEYADKNAFLNAIGRPNSVQKRIENDHGSKSDIQDVWRESFKNAHGAMDDGAVLYSFMPQGGDQMMMMMMMMEAGVEPRHEIIWKKNNHVLGRVDYAYIHEPIVYAWKDGGHKFYGGFQTSVIECARPQKSGLHPTTKPVELIERLLENSSLAGEIVYEPFSGSGTTLIACDRLGRRCRAIEIDPGYVAVALERWAAATGQAPVLVDPIGG